MEKDMTMRPQDASLINLTEDDEVLYWIRELGIATDQLKRLALKHHGSAAAVREELRRWP